MCAERPETTPCSANERARRAVIGRTAGHGRHALPLSRVDAPPLCPPTDRTRRVPAVDSSSRGLFFASLVVDCL